MDSKASARARCHELALTRGSPRAQAKAMAPECEAGARLRAAAAALPLVLMVDKDSPYRDVMRGIELGAADVLEKPLSSLKLRNIWQHVVRKVRSPADAIAGGRRLVSIFSLMHSLSRRHACLGARPLQSKPPDTPVCTRALTVRGAARSGWAAGMRLRHRRSSPRSRPSRCSR